MISIEPCRDHTILALLNRDVQDLHHRIRPDIFKPWNPMAIAADLENMLDSGGMTAFLARYHTNEAGYILLRINDSPETAFSYPHRHLYIDQIVVRPEFRGRGIGRVLLQKAVEIARQTSCQSLRLDHWTTNEGARAFFGKNGFRYYNERMEMQIDQGGG